MNHPMNWPAPRLVRRNYLDIMREHRVPVSVALDLVYFMTADEHTELVQSTARMLASYVATMREDAMASEGVYPTVPVLLEGWRLWVASTRSPS